MKLYIEKISKWLKCELNLKISFEMPEVLLPTDRSKAAHFVFSMCSLYKGKKLLL